MEVVRLDVQGEGSLAAKAPLVAGAVAVGNFDGVHLGHQALVRAALVRAHAAGRQAVALTFDPHPAQVLAPERAPQRLMTSSQKEEALRALGLDILAVLPFTPGVAALSPENFVARVLKGALGALAVVVGAGFRFGAGRAGDVPRLRSLGAAAGMAVVEVAAVLEDGLPVSSTRIREALRDGDVEAAARLLGRAYFVDGRVVPGDARGRTLGFPTANLLPANEILPRSGVYAARVRALDETPLARSALAAAPDDEGAPAVVNLGIRPTFAGQGDVPRLEAHLLDFAGELYGRTLRVSFMARLRDEIRFPGAEALRVQIGEDVARARAVLRLEGAGV